MQEITTSVFVADDGTKFTEKKDCVEYELRNEFNKALHAPGMFYDSDAGFDCIASFETFQTFVEINYEFVKDMLDATSPPE